MNIMSASSIAHISTQEDMVRLTGSLKVTFLTSLITLVQKSSLDRYLVVALPEVLHWFLYLTIITHVFRL